jgi:hypothetical protein
VRGPSGNRPRERSGTSGWRGVALLDMEGGDLAAGVIPCWRIVDRSKCRSLCEWQLLKALRAPCGLRLGAGLHLNIKYYIIEHRHKTWSGCWRCRNGNGHAKGGWASRGQRPPNPAAGPGAKLDPPDHTHPIPAHHWAHGAWGARWGGISALLPS